MNAVGIVIIALFVLFLILKKQKKGDNPSSLVLGDAYKAKKSDRTVENNHVIHTIYKYRENENVWICPNCEAESSGESSVCPVCHYSK